MLTIHQEQTPEGYTICRPVGELDAFTVSQFRQALAEMASSTRLLIDMSGVPFVDSAGLGALIGGIAGGGKGAGIGALVGAGAGLLGGAVTGNQQIEIPAESALSFRMSAPLTLPPPGQ